MTDSVPPPRRPPTPTAKAIAKAHGLPADECWACGTRSKPERAHVVPYSLNRVKVPAEDYALLCPACHLLAPDVDDPDYFWDWVQQRAADTINTFAAAATATATAAAQAGGDEHDIRRVLREVAERTTFVGGRWSEATKLWVLRETARRFGAGWQQPALGEQMDLARLLAATPLDPQEET